MREPAFDKAHCTFERDLLRRQEQVDMVGHGNEGVQLIVTCLTIVLDCFKEQVGVGRDLKEAAAVEG